MYRIRSLSVTHLWLVAYILAKLPLWGGGRRSQGLHLDALAISPLSRIKAAGPVKNPTEVEGKLGGGSSSSNAFSGAPLAQLKHDGL